MPLERNRINNVKEWIIVTIYLDIILIENILMNYIILFATFIITKGNTKYIQLRLILASILGSIYAVIVYLNVLNISSNIVGKILLSIAMVYLAYLPTNIKELLKKLLIFYLVSFVFGGSTIALLYIVKPENVQIKHGVFVGIYPIKISIIAGVVAFFITQIAFKINKAKFTARDMICKLCIFYNNKKINLSAFIDTGNMLEDPISKMPVIVVEKECAKQFIPKEFFEYIESILGGDKKQKENSEKINKYLSKTRLIPFKSLGKENGMLVGVRVDKVNIKYNDNIYEIKNVIIGIYDKKLTKDNKYNALIGLKLLEKEDKEIEFATNT